MSGLVSTSPNKIAARYRALGAAAGVSVGGGGAGTGQIGAQLVAIGLEVGQVARIVENQGLGGAWRGRVASRGVASRVDVLRNQGLGASGRLIASYRTALIARAPAAGAADRARAAGGACPPKGGRLAHSLGVAHGADRPERRAEAPLEAVQAQQGPKNRENPAATHGVGGGSTPESAPYQRFKRLNSRAKTRPGCCKSGRGETSAVRLRWGKAASLCRGRNRVN